MKRVHSLTRPTNQVFGLVPQFNLFLLFLIIIISELLENRFNKLTDRS